MLTNKVEEMIAQAFTLTHFDEIDAAAEMARDEAEENFKLGKLDMAIDSIMSAQLCNPDLPGLFGYFAAYVVHKAAAMDRSLYKILRVSDPFCDLAAIKTEYKKLALLLHPDKNKSVAADGAFKIINAAWNVLSHPQKREAYNRSKGFLPKRNASVNQSGSRNQTQRSSSSPAAAAAENKRKPATRTADQATGCKYESPLKRHKL